MCLTPTLSWLYPAHTGQVSSFPEAQRSLEASEANGTVSQCSICLTRPWLTGARLNLRGPRPFRAQIQTIYHLTHVRAKTQNQSVLSWQLRLFFSIGKLAEGNSASILKGDRMLDCRLFCCLVLHKWHHFHTGNATNVEFPLFFFFPIVVSISSRWLLLI